MATTKCVSCGKRLEDGFLLDHRHGANYAGSWVGGPAEKTWWGGVRLRGRRRLDASALRCTGCGLVHLYAPDTLIVR